MLSVRVRTRLLAAAAALITAVTGLEAGAAHADTSPPNSALPATVSADALPTVQINGVAWAQVVVGNTVYVTGQFTSARPAGSPAGTNETPRANLLAYDITTGALLPFNHTLNSVGKALSVSPDGSTLYVVGNFTKADGKTRSRIAAFNLTTNTLVAGFAPVVNALTNTVVASANAIYLGGQFTAVNGVARTRLAALAPGTGALLDWAPTADNGSVAAMVLNPSGTKLIVGGQFTTVNQSGGGYGLVALDPATGAILPWTAAGIVRNGGTNAGIWSLSTDGTQVFGTGWVYGSGGNLEGAFAADGDTGSINWLEDCHGDTYGLYATSTVAYVVSHEHYCGNIGGFPETNPRTWYRATAFTNFATGTVAHNAVGSYTDWYGQASPTLLDWFPTLKAGTYTGQSQAAWTVVGNGTYLSLAGEFPSVNGVAQQGLVRFAVSSVAPNKVGPKFTGATAPTVSSLTAGAARVAWTAAFDQDNEALTYSVVRDGKTSAPVYSTTVNSTFWNRPVLAWTDTGLVPGSTHTYRIDAKDPSGNITRSTTVSVTVATTSSVYPGDVVNDGALDYWRLDDTSGTSFADSAGTSPLTSTAGITRGQTGIFGDTPGAAAFDGTQGATAGSSTAITGPNTFTVEAWFSTTSTSGGKIIGFGNSQLGVSGDYDRHVYLDNAGHVIFGVYPNAVRTVSSPGTYNDGAWHAVVATLSSAGMVLYVDGQPVASDPSTTSAQAFSGYWRVGGDNLDGWPSQPSSRYFSGTLDEVAVYPTALTADQVRTHYQDSGRTP